MSEGRLAAEGRGCLPLGLTESPSEDNPLPLFLSVAFVCLTDVQPVCGTSTPLIKLTDFYTLCGCRYLPQAVPGSSPAPHFQ